MGWPEITIIVVYAICAGIVLAQQKRMADDAESAWLTVVFAAFVMLILLVVRVFAGGKVE